MKGGTDRLPVESQTIEWKQSLGEWKEIVETCAAFASTDGGTVYIGVTPRGERLGVQVGQKTLEDLANKIKVNTDPPQFPTIEVKGPEQAALIEVRVEQNPVKPVWAFGRPVKRVGRTNQFLRRDESQRLLEATTGRTWDSLTCEGFAAADLSRRTVTGFLNRAGMQASTPTADVVKNLRLRSGDGFANAAVLLFGKQPQRFFVEAQTKCARFKGTDSVQFLDERTLDGSILEQLDNAMAFVARNTRQAIVITGSPAREVVPEYPPEAVREAITNALCHRDYAAVGTVQVRIYDNCLEVWNPGALPSALPVRKLYTQHRSYPRNALLAAALFRARCIEQWGTGTLRIIEACRRHGITVEFESDADTFIVRLRLPPQQQAAPQATGEVTAQVGTKSALSRHQVEILHKCLQERAVRDLISITGRSDRTKFRHQVLNPLLDAGLIEMTIPDKPRSSRQKYRLTALGRQCLAQAEAPTQAPADTAPRGGGER